MFKVIQKKKKRDLGQNCIYNGFEFSEKHLLISNVNLTCLYSEKNLPLGIRCDKKITIRTHHYRDMIMFNACK